LHYGLYNCNDNRPIMKWMALACILLVLMAGIGERTTHFSVKYGDSTEFAPGVGRTLEDCYRFINDYFGNLPKTINVVVVDGAKMDNVGKHVEAFSAWNNKSSTIVLRDKTLKDKKSLGVVAKHEICHLALNDILAKKGGHEFAWMEEGTCMVLSKEPLDDVKVAKYIVANGFMDLPGIAQAIDSKEYAITKNGYLQSFSLCKYLANQFGTETLINIIKCPSPNFEAAFLKNTGRSFGPFYDAWKASVEDESQGMAATHVLAVRGYLCLDLDD
jgi:hypothetical protein